MKPPLYLFRRSKHEFSPTVWPVGVRGWIFLLACNLGFLLCLIASWRSPVGIWTAFAGGLALLSVVALFVGLLRHTDWTNEHE